jgi:hypothetical protein
LPKASDYADGADKSFSIKNPRGKHSLNRLVAKSSKVRSFAFKTTMMASRETDSRNRAKVPEYLIEGAEVPTMMSISSGCLSDAGQASPSILLGAGQRPKMMVSTVAGSFRYGFESGAGEFEFPASGR